MFSTVSSWMEWGDTKPYRETNMALESTEMPSTSPETAEDKKEPKDGTGKPVTDPSVPDGNSDDTSPAATSWWDYAKTSKLNLERIKESAQNIDYKKFTDKLSQNINKESVSTATKGLGSYLSTVYGDLKTSVDKLQQDGIPYTDELFTDFPMLSEFDEEQKKFMKMQQRREGAAIAPWVGYNEEEKMKQQILSLSSEERNVLRDPPAGVDFLFDLDSNMPVAVAMLEADPKLNNLRFQLVPRTIKEERFWRNYFYRVSLIKQSTQLTTLQKSTEEQATANKERIPSQDEAEYSFSPNEDEFISDHLSGFEDAKDELSDTELQQIGLKKTETEEWDKELEKELQEFDMVGDEEIENKLETENFEEELEQMLQNQ